MAVSGDLYSRIITALKVLLPLFALGLLSTLFLFSDATRVTDSIPYTEVDIEELAREPRLTAPNYAGVTEDGAAIAIYADVARPDPDDPRTTRAEALEATIEAQGGLEVKINAAEGALNDLTDQITLTGDVLAVTSTGYRMRSDHMVTSMEGALLSSDMPVQVEGPFGTLDAGRMTLSRNNSSDNTDGGGYVLVFNGGVKLVYEPQK